MKLLINEGQPLSDKELYRRLIGKLSFLTNTRPDLAFTVQHLSKFMSNPCLPHLEVGLHTLRYINVNPDQGLIFNKNENFTLQAFCDSDWAACPHSRRSVSGFFIMVGGSLISWKSKKQVTISLSSAQAEYRSMRRVTTELAWLSRLLHELSIPNVTPIPVKCDSQAAIYIAKNLVFHERTKHVEIDCHFVRENYRKD